MGSIRWNRLQNDFSPVKCTAASKKACALHPCMSLQYCKLCLNWTNGSREGIKNGLNKGIKRVKWVLGICKFDIKYIYKIYYISSWFLYCKRKKLNEIKNTKEKRFYNMLLHCCSRQTFNILYFGHAANVLISGAYTDCNKLKFLDHQHYKQPERIVKVRATASSEYFWL